MKKITVEMVPYNKPRWRWYKNKLVYIKALAIYYIVIPKKLRAA